MLNEELIGIFSHHATMLQRVATREGLAVAPYLDKIREEVRKRFDREIGKTLTPNRKKKLQDDIAKITSVNLQAYVNELRVTNRAVAANEVVFVSQSVDEVLKSDVPVVIPTASAVNAAIVGSAIKVGKGRHQTYNNLMKNFWTQYTEQMEAIVVGGFVSGATTDEIVNQLMKDVDSTLTRTRKSAETVARTGLNHAANAARDTYYQDNDFVIGYRIISVIDSKTSQTCRGLDNKVVKKTDKNYEALKGTLHTNCRKSDVPEIDGRYKMEDDDDKRITNFNKGNTYNKNSDKKRTGGVSGGRKSPKGVDSNQSYYQSLKSLKAADQDNILGSTMGRAFRNLNDPDAFAKLTIDSLGNPYTIAQMRASDNALGKILKEQRPTKRYRK